MANQDKADNGPMLTVLLPAYNEEENLGALLSSLQMTFGVSNIRYRVVVVDDGSSDGTSRVATQMSEAMPITLVEHKTNRGLAQALRTGFLVGLADMGDEDVLVTMDADNTHPPGLIPRMAQGILEGHDVVVASRYRPGSQVFGVPFQRRLLSRGASWLFRVIFPIRGIRDYTCGFRAYRATSLLRVMEGYGESFVSETGFSCMVDILLKMRGNGFVFGEVPLILRYDKKLGTSKMRVASTVLETLKLMLRRRFEGRRTR